MRTKEYVDEEIYRLYQLMAEAWFAKKDRAHADFFYRRLRKEYHVDLFYEVMLRHPVKFVHPLGSVLGRATYAPHLCVYQGVSVGSTLNKERPVFTGPCVLYPHSGVIGNVTVGRNVYITAGVIVQAAPGTTVEIPDNSVVVRAADGWAAKPTQRRVEADYFAEPRPPTPESMAALGVRGYV